MSVEVCINPQCKSCGWESDVEYDINTDTITVRVRRLDKDSKGRIFKRGAIFQISEEVLCNMAEGMPYTHRTIPHNRIELILEDMKSE